MVAAVFKPHRSDYKIEVATGSGGVRGGGGGGVGGDSVRLGDGRREGVTGWWGGRLLNCSR